jgi:hypothetical protein
MNFDVQLKRAVDTLGERLRDDITRELRLLADDLVASAQADREAAASQAAQEATEKAEASARLQAERIAVEAAEATRAAVAAVRAEHAAVAAETPPPTAVPSTHAEPDDLEIGERLVAAIRAIDRARSLSEVLNALLESASHEAERAGVLLIRGRRARGWRFAGFPSSFDGTAIDIGLEESGIIAHAVEHRRAASSDSDGPAPAFAELSEHADSSEAIAIPIALAGEVVAVLYVDQRDPEPGILTLEPATLEVLARHAASALEALTAVKAVRSITRTGETSGHTSAGGSNSGDGGSPAAADASLFAKASLS